MGECHLKGESKCLVKVTVEVLHDAFPPLNRKNDLLRCQAT